MLDLRKNPDPINKTAALVVFGNKDFEETNKDIIIGYFNKGAIYSNSILPIVNCKRNDCYKNYIGKRIGNIVVCGIFDRRYYIHKCNHVSTGQKWVVKCECGIYEIRTTKFIKNSKFSECHICDKAKYLKYINEK